MTWKTANQGTRKTNTSGFKGVSWYARTGKWNAQVCHQRKYYNLGYFDTPEEAHEAYKVKALELFGEFAYDGLPA
jgi:hypothetical protein